MQARARTMSARTLAGAIAGTALSSQPLVASSRATVAEEISESYKDVLDVVNVVEQAGIGKIVARLRPLAVIKG